MKKISLFLLPLLLMCSFGAFAQRLYVSGGLGFAFPMQGQKIDQYGNALNGTVTHYTTGSTVSDLKSASFTAGLKGVLSVGFVCSKNISIELDGAIGLASHEYAASIIGLTNSAGQSYDYIGHRKAVTPCILMPELVLQTDKNKWNLFMKMGLALPLNTRMMLDETYEFPNQIDIYKWTIKNYWSLGYTATCGIKYSVSDDVALWADVNMLSLNIARKERDIESIEVDGKNYPQSSYTGIKQYHYNKEGISNGANQQSVAQPFSSLGINVGVTYRFGKHHKS
jgi:opacity protein-like surface antigen